MGKKFLNFTGLQASKFSRFMIEAEDFNDYQECYPPRRWWSDALKAITIASDDELIENLSNYYWERRMSLSFLIGSCHEIIQRLHEEEVITVILCGTDGIQGMKRQRIKRAGLHQLVSEMLIVGENITSKREGFQLLLQKHDVEPSDVFFVDDKPRYLNQALRLSINPVHFKFDGPLRLAWQETLDPRIPTIEQLTEILKFL